MKINFSKLTYLFVFLIILSNCAKVDPTTGEKVLIETDAKKKAEEAARKGGGIFGDIGKRNSNTNFEFATSNILWRATLKSLEFLPLLNADYGGGIIIYDWYSQPNSPKEQIKISIQFLNNELRSDSVKVIAHKKVCDNADKCSNSMLDQNFADSIKESIIVTARTLKIEETKKEKK
jgi:hypothetical protein